MGSEVRDGVQEECGGTEGWWTTAEGHARAGCVQIVTK